jgi:hypothetical protein
MLLKESIASHALTRTFFENRDTQIPFDQYTPRTARQMPLWITILVLWPDGLKSCFHEAPPLDWLRLRVVGIRDGCSRQFGRNIEAETDIEQTEKGTHE